jgi:hypothetical protein
MKRRKIREKRRSEPFSEVYQAGAIGSREGSRGANVSSHNLGVKPEPELPRNSAVRSRACLPPTER